MTRWPAEPTAAAKRVGTARPAGGRARGARAAAASLVVAGLLTPVLAAADTPSAAGLPPTEAASAVRVDAEGAVWFRHAAPTGGGEAVTRVAADGTRARFASLRAAVEANPTGVAGLGTLPGFWAVAADGGIWVGGTRFAGGAWQLPAAPAGQLADRVALDPAGRAWVPFDPAGACPAPEACAPAGLVAFGVDGRLAASVAPDPEPALVARGLPMVHFPTAGGDAVAILPHGLVRLADGSAHPFAALAPDPASGRRPAGFASAAAGDPAGRPVAFLTLERDDPAAPAGLRYDVLAHAWDGSGWEVTDLSDSPLCADRRDRPCVVSAAGFDAAGTLWLAAHAGGLAARGADGAWHVHYHAGNSPLSGWVAGIDAAPDGTLWLATTGGGLVLQGGRWSPWGRLFLPLAWQAGPGRRDAAR